MRGFFKEEEVRNAEASSPWKKGDMDRMLNLYFAGTAPGRIAVALERNPKSIARRLEQLTANTDGIAEKYQPVNRLSRKGKRLTENEIVMLKSYKKRGISLKILAKVMARPISDFGLDTPDLIKVADMRKVGTGVDLCLAYRYLYYTKHISILSDQAYDEIEKEEIEFGAHGDLLKKPGSDNSEDYPPHIRALALYLVFKHTNKEEKKD